MGSHHELAGAIVVAVLALSSSACGPSDDGSSDGSGIDASRPAPTSDASADTSLVDGHGADAQTGDVNDAGTADVDEAGLHDGPTEQDAATEIDASFDSGLTGEAWFEPIEGAVRNGTITSVQGFMASLPAFYRDSYVLMEVSHSIQNTATLQQPRIILFGPDARVLIGIATNPADPAYQSAEVATLDGVTGMWNFRDFNFTGTPATVGNTEICTTCHGTPARPIWGTYLNWPGAYGNTDNALTSAEANQLNELRETQDASTRFQSLPLLPSYAAGDTFSLPGRSYPYALTDFNTNLGQSLAMALFIRMKNSNNYAAFMKPALDLYLCAESSASAAKVIAAGATYPGLPGALQLMGLNVTNDFDIAVEASSDAGISAISDTPWDQAYDYLINFVMFLVANDLLQENRNELTSVFAPVLDAGAGGGPSWTSGIDTSFLTGTAAFDFQQNYGNYLDPHNLFTVISSPLCAYLEQ